MKKVQRLSHIQLNAVDKTSTKHIYIGLAVIFQKFLLFKYPQKNFITYI